MNKQKDQFIALLGELFQLNQPELDFGLYRILHARSAQIKAFIDTELGSEIDAHFAEQSQSNAHDSLEAARVKVAETLGEDAFLPTGELKPEYRGTKVGKEFELAQQQARDGGGVLADDAQVYEHLYRFFSRYYDKGDFMSKRYFVAENDSRAAPYAVPYDGREVMLHWANKDQYYIKSSEALSNFTFDLSTAQAKEQGQQSGFDFQTAHATPLKVHFRLAAAAEGEHNNVKESQERFFIIHASQALQLEVNDQGQTELVVQFDYRPDAEKSGQAGTWQQKRLAEAEQVVAEQLENLRFAHPELRPFQELLFAPAPTDKNPNRTLLGKYLGQFIAPHMMDYFIHKDLGGFLRRELDFYIKNEIVRLDDIESTDAPRADEFLKKLRILRKIARKIIEFLAQLENFQKKLWLKKKFVIETQYLIPLALVSREAHPEILENLSQLLKNKEAKHSDKTEAIRVTISELENLEKDPNYAPKSLIDTSLLNPKLKEKIIAQAINLDDELGGILINADNFQGLSLIKRYFQESVSTIFIDPPYNTGKSDFPYKDNYQHSSWMSMMQDRCSLAKDMLSPQGLFSIQIGDEETANVRCVFDSIFAERKNSIIVRRGIKNVQAQFDDIDRLSLGHDTIHTYAKHTGVRLKHLKQALDEEKPGKWDTFWRGTDRKTMRYELLGITPETGQWRWEINRALRAARAYEDYLNNESTRKTLDEHYIENLQAGIDLDFVRLSDDGVVQYYVPPQAARLVSDNWLDIAASGNITDFQHEKSIPMLQRLISWSSKKNDWTLDYFAGSGSTGHAALTMPESRRFIMIEMGMHFDNVLLPRITQALDQKIINEPKVIKILRLESFEDTLNNLQLPDKPRLNISATDSSEMARDYLLKYWLEFETAGSPSLLNVREFSDPTSYKLKVKQPGSDAQVEKTIDLVETFNWLIGLHVAHLDQPRRYAIELVRETDPELPQDQDTRWRATSIKEREDGEFWFRAVEGHVLRVPGDELSRERVLVIWRKLTGHSGRDQAALEAWLGKRGINPRESEFATIYVNGNHALPSDGEAAMRVRLIEETFAQRMWEDA